MERQTEHLKGELAAMKEENGALKKENRDKKCRVAALEKSKDDGEKVQTQETLHPEPLTLNPKS